MDRRTLYSIAAAHSQRSTPDFVEWLGQRLDSTPGCPVANYLLGCHCFDRGRGAQAVRHMMTAHHAEPTLESAALLVFSGLNWISPGAAGLLPVLLDTWEEFRRPEFDRNRRERRLLDIFADSDAELNGVSPLARRLWRLPIRTLRAQIREAVLSPGSQQYALLLTPA